MTARSRRRATSMAGGGAVALLVTVLPMADVAAGAPVTTSSVAISKSTSQISVEAGSDVNFEIEVTNTGHTALTDVVVSDAAAPDCDRNLGTLAIGRTERYSCSYTTSGADVGNYENTATVASNETSPVASGAVSTTVTAGDDPVSVEYTCNNPNPFDNTPITSSFDINLFDDVDPAEPGETVTWSLDVDQPSLGSLPTEVTVSLIRLTVPRPANLANLQLNLSNPPGQTANPATNLTTATVNLTNLVIETPNNGQKIVAKTDGSLVFPQGTNNPVVLPRASFSAEPTVDARGTDIQWKPPTLRVEGTAFGFGVTVNCAPTDNTVTLVSTRVNPERAALDVDLEAAQSSVEAGDPIDYSGEVANRGNVALTGVTVSAPGAADCDRPALGAVAVGVAEPLTCQVTGATDLVPFAKGDFVAVTATADSTEVGPVSSHPAVVQVTLPPTDWTDIAAWYADAADWLDFWELATGYDGNTFRGGNDITRGALARMVYRLAGEPEVAVPDPEPFTDMPGWALDAVRWVAEDPDGPRSPLMTGVGGAFLPLEPITRGQVVRLLYRFAGEPPVDLLDPNPFPDSLPWVDDAARWAAHDPDGDGPLEPIIAGIDGQLKPGDPITRAQVARMLFRLWDRLPA